MSYVLSNDNYLSSNEKDLGKRSGPISIYCDMHACLRPLLSNGPRSTVNSGNVVYNRC
jgi:hypothetical protein